MRRAFSTQVESLLCPPTKPGDGPPSLLVCLHGQGQSGARQQRWMGPAVPARFAACFPDGFYPMEVRRPDRGARIGRAWYHYSTVDRQGFLASLDGAVAALWLTVDAALDELGADPGAVWLAGFSQGAYLAAVAALRQPKRVAGFVLQAGSFREDYIPGGLPDLEGCPVLLQHGERDEAVGPETGRTNAQLLEAAGADVTLQLFDAGHVITPEMAASVRAWLEQRA